MSFILSWRRVALACVLLMAAAGVLALRSLPGADAQQPPGTSISVVSGFPVTASNGHVTLVDSINLGLRGIECTGFAPRTGRNIVGQVVTELGLNDTRLRIMRNDGTAITGTVRLNCVLEVDTTPLGNATADRFREATKAG